MIARSRRVAALMEIAWSVDHLSLVVPERFAVKPSADPDLMWMRVWRMSWRAFAGASRGPSGLCPGSWSLDLLVGWAADTATESNAHRSRRPGANGGSQVTA